MAAIPRLREYRGPAVLSYGFRPFYLLGSLFAGLGILIWLPVFAGTLELSSHFIGRDWHVHEMLYGYLAAIITGYLMTALPNWTGKLPAQGGPLLVLLFAWLAGRVAVALSAHIGWLAALVIDNAFILLVALAAGREIVAGKNWQNLKVVVALAVLFAGNLIFHIEAHTQGVADVGMRIGIAVVIGLIMLIGGRIIPSFTRNWLARQKPGPMPATIGPLDTANTAFAIAVLCLWVAVPYGPIPAAALLAAGVLQVVRLVRWVGYRTWGNPLVLIMHLAYAFVPAGFVLVGLSAFGTVPPTAGLHAWTAGAMGAMTLAVMSRTSLGLTGRPRVASVSTQILYALVIFGALARVWSAVDVSSGTALLHAAGGAWAAAFLGFAVVYWPVLTGPRPGR